MGWECWELSTRQWSSCLSSSTAPDSVTITASAFTNRTSPMNLPSTPTDQPEQRSTTGLKKKTPHKYTAIKLEECAPRLCNHSKHPRRSHACLCFWFQKVRIWHVQFLGFQTSPASRVQASWRWRWWRAAQDCQVRVHRKVLLSFL